MKYVWLFVIQGHENHFNQALLHISNICLVGSRKIGFWTVGPSVRCQEPPGIGLSSWVSIYTPPNFEDHVSFWHDCFFPIPIFGKFWMFLSTAKKGGNCVGDGVQWPCQKWVYSFLNLFIYFLNQFSCCLFFENKKLSVRVERDNCVGPGCAASGSLDWQKHSCRRIPNTCHRRKQLRRTFVAEKELAAFSHRGGNSFDVVLFRIYKYKYVVRTE